MRALNFASPSDRQAVREVIALSPVIPVLFCTSFQAAMISPCPTLAVLGLHRASVEVGLVQPAVVVRQSDPKWKLLVLLRKQLVGWLVLRTKSSPRQRSHSVGRRSIDFSDVPCSADTLHGRTRQTWHVAQRKNGHVLSPREAVTVGD